MIALHNLLGVILGLGLLQLSLGYLIAFLIRRDALIWALRCNGIQLLLWPFSACSWTQRGNLWGDLKHWQAAETCFQRALRLRPDWIEAHLGQGTASLVLHDNWQQADGHFIQAYILRRGQPQLTLQALPSGLIHKKQLPSIEEAISAEQIQAWQTQWQWLQQKHALGPCPMPTEAGVLLRPQQSASPVLNAQNWTELESQYQQGAGLVVIDNLLSPACLQQLLDCCQQSTFWHHLYPHQYQGAYLDDGLSNPLLYQLAEALRHKLPAVLGENRLVYLWAFKCHGSGPGVVLHHDSAVVNVNFWLTPDRANRDPERGGICVYTHEPPRQWDLERYALKRNEMEDFIRQNKAPKKCISYQQNRAVIFNSRLLHATQAYAFGPDYTEQRINLTLLFGRQPLRYHPKMPLPDRLKNVPTP